KMNVTIIREYFDKFGEIGRIFLQPSEKKKKQRGPNFTEGWIEFKRKRDAKVVAKRLNNQQVNGRRRTPWYDEIWNI
ncbi:unnamed protein product, partial [Didymodactylos carnosus]